METTSFVGKNGEIIKIENTQILPEEFLGKRVFEALYYLQDKGWLLKPGGLRMDPLPPGVQTETTFTFTKEEPVDISKESAKLSRLTRKD